MGLRLISREMTSRGTETYSRPRFGQTTKTGLLVSKWRLTSTEIIWLIRDGEKGGKGVGRLGERGIIYLSLHCHHQNDFCIKVGGDESHSNDSLIVRDKVTRQRPQTTTFQGKGEPKQIRTEVPLLTSLTPYR